MRLLTLTGPGGVGKTHLALHVAAGLALDYPDGVAVVALAPVRDPALVLPTVARVMGLRDDGQPPLERLRAALAGKHLLLVLDNLEHLLPAAREVAALLAACPRLEALATSRAALRVRAEQLYPVPPLALPGPVPASAPGAVAEYAAVRLFLHRVRAVKPDFALTPETAPAVAEICRRLDGLPLAIELAAARVKLLPPAALLARLDRRVPLAPLLADGARDLPERLRTMERALAWSHDLLDAEERTLFRRLSVFVGGWTLEAAEAVCGQGIGEGEGPRGAASGQTDVLDGLARLADQSLIAAEPEGTGVAQGGMRYRMLEPIRHYAAERLEASGEADDARRRHAATFRALAERAAAALKGRAQAAWMARLEAELANLRAALAWMTERAAWEDVAAFGYALWIFWTMRGYINEGRGYVETALARAEELSPLARARLLSVAAVLAHGQGDYARAEPLAGEGLALFRQVGDRPATAWALGLAGVVAFGQGRHERAEALLEECAAAYRELGDPHEPWEALACAWAAPIALARGEDERALGLARRGLEIARAAGDCLSHVASLFTLATVARRRGDHEGAVSVFAEALRLSVDVGDRSNAAYCLEGVAEVAAEQGRPSRAARLWGAAATLLATFDPELYPHTPDRARRDAAVASTRARLGEGPFAEAWAVGERLTLEQAVAEAVEAWEDRSSDAGGRGGRNKTGAASRD